MLPYQFPFLACVEVVLSKSLPVLAGDRNRTRFDNTLRPGFFICFVVHADFCLSVLKGGNKVYQSDRKPFFAHF